MKKIIRIIFTLLMLTSIVSAQANKDMKMDKKMSCCSDKSSCDVDSSKMHNAHDMDLKSMDKNKDGKLFQCSMCKDQISDEAGECPKCGMKLKEVSIEEATEAMKKGAHEMMNHEMMGHKDMDHSKMKNKMMDHDKKEMHGMKMKMDTDHSKMMMSDGVVRTGMIDLKQIDENNDGFVYQDLMDWNVISDSEGECPVCGMKLKKVSINEAIENLKIHDFKVK